MIVLIAGGPGKEDTAAALAAEVLKGLGIQHRVVELEPGDDPPGETLMEAVSGTTHTCLMVPKNRERGASYFFIAGFAWGRGERRFCYAPDSGVTLSRLEQNSLLGKGKDEIAAFFAEELREWDAAMSVAAAREGLERAGIPLTAEAFCECASAGDRRCMELFLLCGYKPDTRNGRGVPLLCLAARGGHEEAVSLLTQRGADLNCAGGDNGHTPLMDAVASGAAGIAEALIRAGADVNMQSKNGQSALILAASRGLSGVAAVLLEHGANPELMDNLGMTALKYSELFKHTDIVDLIKRTPAERIIGAGQ